MSSTRMLARVSPSRRPRTQAFPGCQTAFSAVRFFDRVAPNVYAMCRTYVYKRIKGNAAMTMRAAPLFKKANGV